MHILLKNLFNPMSLLKISLFAIFTEIFRVPSVKGKSRYRKINFLTTSALFNCIFWSDNTGAHLWELAEENF
jgi:hypothetical protein